MAMNQHQKLNQIENSAENLPLIMESSASRKDANNNCPAFSLNQKLNKECASKSTLGTSGSSGATLKIIGNKEKEVEEELASHSDSINNVKNSQSQKSASPTSITQDNPFFYKKVSTPVKPAYNPRHSLNNVSFSPLQ
jgi:hypothetical protein